MRNRPDLFVDLFVGWLAAEFLLRCRFRDLFDYKLMISMMCGEYPVRTHVGCEIRYVTLGRSDVQRRNADGHDVVNLAGVNNARKIVAHHNHMQVCG